MLKNCLLKPKNGHLVAVIDNISDIYVNTVYYWLTNMLLNTFFQVCYIKQMFKYILISNKNFKKWKNKV